MKNETMHTKGQFLKWKDVHILDGFAGHYQQLCLDVTLPIEFEQLQRTGRLASVKGTWKPGEPQKPHFFWDSDLAKWIEAVSYRLALSPDPLLESRVDEIVSDVEKLQQEDGYFNTFFTLVEPGRRFTYLKRMHELYCLGHMIEAAVAYYDVTGKDALLKVVCRYVDLVEQVFGTEEGKLPGYDGHEEIELALIKLYGITQDPRHLKLASYFVDQRGQSPHFFEEECERRGEPEDQRKYRDDMQGMYAYYQAHQPVRQQTRAVGHAVRAMYLYCAMQDLANLLDDEELKNACEAIWNDATYRQLYITGGIGPNPVGERFTHAYDLPNAMSYNETCASIGLMMFAARRMCEKPVGQYGDVMERAFLNNILGGVSLDGKTFYYANPLSVIPSAYENMTDPRPQVTVLRQKWFDVACCPPNLARLLTSLGGYIYLQQKDSLFVNLYMSSEASFEMNGCPVHIQQQTDYPWDGRINVTVDCPSAAPFTLALRLPGWSCKSYSLLSDGHAVDHEEKDGFLLVSREWAGRQTLTLELDMRVRITHARPEVSMDCGRVALERGPLVYCFEECDNGKCLNDLRLDLNSVCSGSFDSELLGGIIPIYARALRRKWPEENALYLEWEPATEEVKLTAVPFYARYNRGAGEMAVWLQSQQY